MAWNGASASWLGFDRDERLCQRITAATGAKAVTTTLAYREILARGGGAKRIGLVTPYTDDVQTNIIANWKAAGLAVTAERHLGITDNFAFAEVEEAMIARMTREVISEGCDSIVVLCTNMRAAALAESLEAGSMSRCTIPSP